MTAIEIFLLALALSIDACVVSFSYGLSLTENRIKYSLLLAAFTGIFQGIMPLGGFYLTSLIKSYIEPYASLIVFLIFIYLGLKFIKEAFENKKNKPCCISLACLFLIGIATSLDAFSAGVTLALYGNKILTPAILITIITFLNSILGFKLGENLKKIPTRSLEVIAGMVLIFLGIKALF